MATETRGKRRSKNQYQSPAGGKRQRWGRELEVGMQGMLITCNMNQRKCTAEAYSLLNEYADQLYGPETFAEDEGNSKSEGEDSEDDVEAALKKEVKQICTSTERQLRRFQALESGANNVVFIRTLNIEPDKLVHHILKDLHTTKKKKTRAILRMLPVSGSCKAFMEEIPKYVETFMEPWFKDPKKATFQIVYKARNNSHMSRDDVIKALAGVVIGLNPENKVDLNNPEYTIIVEIIKSVCCVSVVQDYILFRKYNLQEVAKSEAEENRGTQPEPDRSQSVREPQEGKEVECKSKGEEQETSVTRESEKSQEVTSQQ